ncbi:Ldh family oxidoreductase [Pigmentiphaga aceris]|uniref:Ldh family oxidoreductase n=1 Tax=Pigmentiphaga aceris TaxID=1940612 RepID=A0A5C0B5A5_9BURK|nr:Ldh family oxidoreductase [Pigmentiphaga aceris]QEI08843.1 Ldh family oxidoreductase [Pigmentiphaga aceris]
MSLQPVAADALPYAAESLRNWGAACLRALNVPDEAADEVARSLVQTSLRGIDSHGIARLPHYLDRIAHGSIRPQPAITTTRSGPSTAQVHGDQGLGIVVSHHANREAITIAREQGVAAVGVSDSSHCGAVGLYSREAARQGMIGIAFTHSDKIAAPHGGYQAFLGTNPISIAFPRGDGEPVCLDMATTSIPWNQVMNARREGQPLPDGVAVDATGDVTTDAQQTRALSPLGGQRYGHKGYALALMIELLCGPLNGNPYGPQIGPMYEELTRPRHIGAFFIVIDPQRFAGGATLAATIEHLATALLAEPGSPKMPGDPEIEVAAERTLAGIPIEPVLRAQIAAWSERLGVVVPVGLG